VDVTRQREITPAGALGTWVKDARPIRANGLYGLQFLAWLKPNRFSGRNLHFLPGSRITADAGLARSNRKYSKASQLDPVTLGKRLLDRSENCLYGNFGLQLDNPGTLNHSVHDIVFDHYNLLKTITLS
jgi:hypothetical protein